VIGAANNPLAVVGVTLIVLLPSIAGAASSYQRSARFWKQHTSASEPSSGAVSQTVGLASTITKPFVLSSLDGHLIRSFSACGLMSLADTGDIFLLLQLVFSSFSFVSEVPRCE